MNFGGNLGDKKGGEVGESGIRRRGLGRGIRRLLHVLYDFVRWLNI
ncbi:hypothetical protein Hanom_Chr12g01089481 [Helianthus anomalus]